MCRPSGTSVVRERLAGSPGSEAELYEGARRREKELTNRIERWVGWAGFVMGDLRVCTLLLSGVLYWDRSRTHPGWPVRRTGRHGRGFRSSRLYVSQKWGCDAQQEGCVYQHPFNNPAYPLSYWRLDWARCVRLDGFWPVWFLF